MGLDARSRRRLLGALVLGLALLMLLAGETIFQGRLRNLAFVAYWLCCFALTTFAVVIALWDLRAVQRRTRDEHRNLLESTLDDIQAEARARKQRKRTGRSSL